MLQKDQEIFDDAYEENVEIIDQYKELRNMKEKLHSERLNKGGGVVEGGSQDEFPNKRLDYNTTTNNNNPVHHDPHHPHLSSANFNDSKLKSTLKNVVWSADFHDLSGVLPEKDCLFLAAKFWIFSVEQLVYILQGDSSNTTLSHDRDTDQSKMATKEDVLKALMSSNLIDNHAPAARQMMTTTTTTTTGFEDASMNHTIPHVHQQQQQDVDPSSTTTAAAAASETVSSLELKKELLEDDDDDDQQQQQQQPEEGKTAASEERKMKATYRIMAWENSLSLFLCDNMVAGSCRMYQHETVLRNMEKEHFDLRGPLSILFPTYILKFLKSVKIWTSDQFLQAKKTESSKLVSRFSKWRDKNGMISLKPIVLSRYLTGLCTRIQYATSLVPPANEFERSWMGSCLCVLTGSSREFLIGICKFKSQDDFLKTKTKTLSTLVVEWRKTKGMPPLKGSGKVAIISGWKTLVKETIDANAEVKCLNPKKSDETNSSILKDPIHKSDQDTVRMLNEVSANRAVEFSNKDASSTMNDTNDGCISSKLSDKAKHFVILQCGESSPLKSHIWLKAVLEPANIEFLSSVGIKNSEQLLIANERSNGALVSSFIRWRKQHGFPSVDLSSIEQTLLNWILQVEKKLNEIGVSSLETRSRSSNGSPGKDAIEESQQKKDDSYSLDNKMKEEAGILMNIVLKQDPIRKLSENTRRFLQSMNIIKAGDLLSTPSSFVAENYIQWRKDHGITALKGNGAIATISGWKNAVRADAAKALSGSDISDSEHHCRCQKKRKKVPIYSHSKKSKKIANNDSSVIKLTTTPLILLGMPIFSFTVFSPEKSMFYAFKLSLRKRSDSEDDDVSVFLTFIGGRTLGTRQKGDLDAESSRKLHHHSYSNRKDQITGLPILPEVSESDVRSSLKAESLSQNEETEPVDLIQSNFLTFCSKSKECGLLDITRFNAFPKKPDSVSSDRTNELITLFDSFISCQICKPEKLQSETVLNENSKYPFNEQIERNDDNDVLNKSTSDDILDSQYSKKSANVFPCYNKSKKSDCQYLVYINDCLEYGQSIELKLGPRIEQNFDSGSTDSKLDPTAFSSKRNIEERERLLTLVSSLSMRELQGVVVPLHSAFQSLKLDLKSFLGKREEIVNLLSPEKILEHLIIFRRFSWVAGILNSQIEHLLRNISRLSCVNPEWDHTEQKMMRKCISDMSWNSFHQEEVEFLSEFSDGFLFHGFQDELSEEILTLLSSKKLVMYPFDERFWCPLSSNLLFNLLDLISSYVIMTTHETHNSQNELFENILHHVNNALRILENGCDLSRNLTVNYKRFLEQVAFEPSNSSDTTLQNLAERKNSNCIESESTQVYDFEESFVVCAAETKRLPVSDVSKASLSIDKIWYITHQISAVVHHVATCGVIKWLKAPRDFHNIPMYSFTRLRNSIIPIEPKRFKLFQKISIQSIYLPATLPVLKSSLFPIDECNQSVSISSSKATPKTLPIFLQTLWPVLSAKGLRMTGNSPSQISYHLTTIPKNCTLNGSISPRDEMNEHKHDKKTRELIETKMVQMPLNLKKILVRATPPLTVQGAENKIQNEENSKYSVNSVLKNYKKFVFLESHDTDETTTKTTLLTIESVERLFNETVVNLMFESEVDFYNHALTNTRKSTFLGFEYFLRMSVMLPCNLKRAGIRKNEIAVIVSVVEEILKYVSIHSYDNFKKSVLLSIQDENRECIAPDVSSKNSFPNNRDQHMKAIEYNDELKQSKTNDEIEFYHHTDLIKFLFESDFIEANAELKECIDNYYTTIERHVCIK